MVRGTRGAILEAKKSPPLSIVPGPIGDRRPECSAAPVRCAGQPSAARHTYNTHQHPTRRGKARSYVFEAIAENVCGGRTCGRGSGSEPRTRRGEGGGARTKDKAQGLHHANFRLQRIPGFLPARRPPLHHRHRHAALRARRLPRPRPLTPQSVQAGPSPCPLPGIRATRPPRKHLQSLSCILRGWKRGRFFKSYRTSQRGNTNWMCKF